jgi:hypothetical protein
MHILALTQKTLKSLEKTSIMKEILNICAFEITSQSLAKLSDCKCFPVKLSSGETQWSNRSGSFAIVDRRAYGQLFAGKIGVLDLTLEHIHSFQAFLLAMGLEGRYISVLVKEEIIVQGGSMSERITKDLRRKSYAICR